MGVYWLAANLDKLEFIHPHAFGDGAKDLEFQYNAGGFLTALAKLLADRDGWRGDRIAIVPDSDGLYDVVDEEFTDVSAACREKITEDGRWQFTYDPKEDLWDRERVKP